MRPALLSWSDSRGGAARAAARLHRALRAEGADSWLVVARAEGDESQVSVPETPAERFLALTGPRADQWPSRRYARRNPALFSSAWLPDLVGRRVRRLRPDLVHLHWINYGFLNLASIPRLPGPIVWTWHDAWPATGGCHYAGECGRWRNGCGACPQLGATRNPDLSARNFSRKLKEWSGAMFTVIAPSRWMAGIASESPLFRGARVEVIPNCIDTETYRPADRAAARRELGLPEDNRPLILFAAMEVHGEPRKGFAELIRALGLLPASLGADLLVMGAGEAVELPGGREVHRLGLVTGDAQVARVFAAADVFVAPSLEDNLPNTVMEALACGTPVVAFRVGGLPDLVVHGETGYLAAPRDEGDLARGIEWMLESPARRAALGTAARRFVEERFRPSVVARQHLDLYEDIVSASRPT